MLISGTGVGYAEFLMGGGQPDTRSTATDSKRRTPYRLPLLFWRSASMCQNCQYRLLLV